MSYSYCINTGVSSTRSVACYRDCLDVVDIDSTAGSWMLDAGCWIDIRPLLTQEVDFDFFEFFHRFSFLVEKLTYCMPGKLNNRIIIGKIQKT